jgi:integrase
MPCTSATQIRNIKGLADTAAQFLHRKAGRMAFLADKEELKPGLVIFRRLDVAHRNWYCRVKLPKSDRYKTISLKTSDISAARERAFDQDSELRFRIKHDVPVFNRPFSQIAKEFLAFQEKRAGAGQIKPERTHKIASVIRAQLDPYVGSVQISLVGVERWQNYPFWRQEHGKGRVRATVSDSTIRYEMSIFRAIMTYAASRHYIPNASIFDGKLQLAKERREEFNPDEYRKLHTFARSWVKQASKPSSIWYRTIAYNFVLIMCNTGMRPGEAKTLRWRDVTIKADREGRKLVVLQVRGKQKSRNLVAASNVADYFERVRDISKATGPDDIVFTTIVGKPAITLYSSMIGALLEASGLLVGPEGTPRSTYSFRHTYATFRLSEGVDVYILAQQMGTSVKMIEDHYGHINPVKNADRILQGMPGWEPVSPAAILPQIGE